MDIWDKKKRSEVMSKIRSKNTKPELIVRKYLFQKGIRYRIHVKNIPGSPDIAIKKYKIAIFINGCFWHGHDNCKVAHIPKSKSDWWENKILKNKIRDLTRQNELKESGWHVYVIWECELLSKRKPEILEQLFEGIKNSILSKTDGKS